MVNREETKMALLQQCEKYPRLSVTDLFKFIYQSSFGCEHLVSDVASVKAYLCKEAETARPATGELLEPLDGDYCRVHLDYLKQGLSADTFAKLFVLSAEHVEDGKERLEEKLSVLLELAKSGMLPFPEEEVEEALKKWHEKDCPACHHSEGFRAEYAPAYRLMKKEYVRFLPVFVKIDRMLAQGRVTLAIEGGSASGKTTLSKLLCQVYDDCTVFHMDDFFLRPEQRTPERFAEPGGNVDRERFLAEVLVPLSENKTVKYRRFDCGTFTILPPVEKEPSALNIIEGAYSMHPELAEYYNISIFLEVSPELQKVRISKRNSPELAKRFFAEWIPMEHRYFEGMDVKDRCDMAVLIDF
jgi:uridine kinase